jgi:hypothetical protein
LRWSCGGCGGWRRRLTGAPRGPSLMATGAPPLPPLHPVCPGGLSGRGGRGGGPGCLGHSFRGKQRRCWRCKSQGDRQPDKGKRSSPRNHFRFDFLAHFRPFFSRRRLQRLFFSSCVKSSGQIADREVPKQSGYTLDRHAELTDRIMFLTYFCLRRKSNVRSSTHCQVDVVRYRTGYIRNSSSLVDLSWIGSRSPGFVGVESISPLASSSCVRAKPSAQRRFPPMLSVFERSGLAMNTRREGTVVFSMDNVRAAGIKLVAALNSLRRCGAGASAIGASWPART